jgi:hypothetical protein
VYGVAEVTWPSGSRVIAYMISTEKRGQSESVLERFDSNSSEGMIQVVLVPSTLEPKINSRVNFRSGSELVTDSLPQTPRVIFWTALSFPLG